MKCSDKWDHPVTYFMRSLCLIYGEIKGVGGGWWERHKLYKTDHYGIWFARLWKWLASIRPAPPTLPLVYSHRLHSLGHMDCTCCWSGGVSLFLMQSGTHRLETFLLFSAVLKTSPMNSTWKWILWILWSGSKESNLKVFSISQTEMPSNIFFLVWVNMPHNFTRVL